MLGSMAVMLAACEFTCVSTPALRSRLMYPEEQSRAQGMILFGFSCGVLGAMMISPALLASMSLECAYAQGVVVAVTACGCSYMFGCIAKNLPPGQYASLEGEGGLFNAKSEIEKMLVAFWGSWPLLLITTLVWNGTFILRENLSGFFQLSLQEPYAAANILASVPVAAKALADLPVGRFIDAMGCRMQFLVLSTIALGVSIHMQLSATLPILGLVLYGVAWSAFNNSALTMYSLLVHGANATSAYSLAMTSFCTGMAMWRLVLPDTHEKNSIAVALEVYMYFATAAGIALWVHDVVAGDGRLSGSMRAARDV